MGRGIGGHADRLTVEAPDTEVPGVEVPGVEVAAGAGEAGRRSRRQPRRWLRKVARWGVTAVLLAVFPFVLLVRGGVFAYQQWGLGAWSSLAVSAAATALLLAFYAWVVSRRLGAGKRLRKFLTRVAALSAAAFVLYSLVVIAGGNVKSDDVRAEYSSLHPLLRMAVSVFVLVDADAVITDAARTPEFYARAGLPANEASLHFRQDDGFVHALDLRTINRREWRNLAAELAFRAMGFHTLRHVGTADHLHVSLRSPD
ncbi:MAG: hypothetical protein OXU74_16985 [Gemmatimonadota bacterium]|nr:hypothetical protein [Gemmatimonadota bacterium]